MLTFVLLLSLGLLDVSGNKAINVFFWKNEYSGSSCTLNREGDTLSLSKIGIGCTLVTTWSTVIVILLS